MDLKKRMCNCKQSLPHREKGLTLIELLIGMAISLIIIGSVITTFVTQSRFCNAQEQFIEMQQNVRASMAMMEREIRMAGYRAPKSNLSSWITWVDGITANPQITDGGESNPDSISIVGCINSANSSLSVAVNEGDTTITLSRGGGDSFNITDKIIKRIFYVGNNEAGLITKIDGDTLTIDTDPTIEENQGLANTYSAGAPVQLVKVITYEIVADTLKRNENTGGGRQPVAENIEDLQISQVGNSITIEITGKTSKPDLSYTHPTKGDHYRRFTISTNILLRN